MKRKYEWIRDEGEVVYAKDLISYPINITKFRVYDVGIRSEGKKGQSIWISGEGYTWHSEFPEFTIWVGKSLKCLT
jgi:hypothetical protein